MNVTKVNNMNKILKDKTEKKDGDRKLRTVEQVIQVYRLYASKSSTKETDSGGLFRKIPEMSGVLTRNMYRRRKSDLDSGKTLILVEQVMQIMVEHSYFLYNIV